MVMAKLGRLGAAPWRPWLPLCVALVLSVLGGLAWLPSWTRAAILADPDADMPELQPQRSAYDVGSMYASAFGRLDPAGRLVSYSLEGGRYFSHREATQQALLADMRLGAFFSSALSEEVTFAGFSPGAAPAMVGVAGPGAAPLFAWQDGQAVGFSSAEQRYPAPYGFESPPRLLAAFATGAQAGQVLVGAGGLAAVLTLEAGSWVAKAAWPVAGTSGAAGLAGHFFLATPTGWVWLRPDRSEHAVGLGAPVLDLAATRYLTADPRRFDLVVATATELLIYLGLGDDGAWRDVVIDRLPAARNSLSLSPVPRVPLITAPTGFLHVIQAGKVLWRANHHPARPLWQRMRSSGGMDLSKMQALPVLMDGVPGHRPEQWALAASGQVFLLEGQFGCHGDDPSIVCKPSPSLWACAPGRAFSPLLSSRELCAGCADGYHQVPLSGQRYECRPCPGEHCRACLAGVCTACSAGFLLQPAAVAGAPSATCVAECAPGFQPQGEACVPLSVPSVATHFAQLPATSTGQTILSMARTRAFLKGDRLYVSNASLSAPEPVNVLVWLSDNTFGLLDMPVLMSTLPNAVLSVRPIVGLLPPVAPQFQHMAELGPVRQPEHTAHLALVAISTMAWGYSRMGCTLPGPGPTDECMLAFQPGEVPLPSFTAFGPLHVLSPTVLVLGRHYVMLGPQGDVEVAADPHLRAWDRPAMATHVHPATGQPASWIYRYDTHSRSLVAQPWDLVRLGDSRLRLSRPNMAIPAGSASGQVARAPVGGIAPARADVAGSNPGHGGGAHLVIEPGSAWAMVSMPPGDTRARVSPGSEYVLLMGLLSHGDKWYWGMVGHAGLEAQGRTRSMSGTSYLLAELPGLSEQGGLAAFHWLVLHLEGVPDHTSALVLLHPDFVGIMLLHCPSGEFACRPGARGIAPYPASLGRLDYSSLGVVSLPRGGALPAGRDASAAFLLVSRQAPATGFVVQVAPAECPARTHGPQCAPCHHSCETCTGPLAGDCVLPVCPVSVASHPGTCLSACPAGLQIDQRGHCACDSSCAACASPGPGEAFVCTACPGGMAVEVAAEAPATRCLPCHGTCRECSAPGRAAACTACRDPGALLRPDGTCVVGPCPGGTWPDARSGECVRCTGGCAECAGPERCTSCRAGFLHEATMGVCLACAPECGSCSASTTECDACGPGYRRADGPPPGGTPSAGRCVACPAGCARCDDGGRCLACRPGQLLTPSGTCVSMCLGGLAPNADMTACEACHPACDWCQAPGLATACLSCSPGLHLQPAPGAAGGPGSCVAACQEGFWSSAGVCVVCGDGCQACADRQSCDRCRARHFPAGDGTCGLCDGTCASCSEPLACDTCAPGRHFPSADPLVRSLCTEVCPAGEFFDAQDHRCRGCAGTCATCLGVADCTACVSGHGWAAGSSVKCALCPAGCRACLRAAACDECEAGLFVTPGGGCAAACPGGTFADVATGRCATCQATCAECADASSCTVCQGGLVFLEAGPGALCTGACPPGTFVGADRCMACDRSCSLCTGLADRCEACAPGFRRADDAPGAGAGAGAGECVACPGGCTGCTRDMCIGCEEGLLLTHGGACVAACPEGTFGEATSATCQPCALECGACVGPGADQCTSCARGMDAWPAAGDQLFACVPSCPAGEYRPGEEHTCLPCHESCSACNGPTDGDCWRCQEEGQVLQDGMCQIECAPGFTSVHDRCVPCHASCGACAGPRVDQCTVCRGGLLALPAGAPTGRCVNSCPMGSGRTAAGCADCAEHCSSCPGGAGACAVCARGWLLAGAGCVASCPARSFDYGGKCEACHGDCATCGRHGPTGCTACPGPSPWLQGGQCLATCPGDTFPEGGQCLPCHPACAACAGPQAAQCMACHGGAFLYGGTCLAACPGGYFAGADQRCQPCHGRCLTCHGPEQDRCLSCPGLGLLHRGQCVDACPAGSFACMGSCEMCDPHCARCTPVAAGPGAGACASSCDACEPGFLRAFATGACGPACPAGEYSAGAGACAPCAGACRTCVDRATVCTSCHDAAAWLRVDTGACVASCPEEGLARAELASVPGRVCLPCPRGCLRCAHAGAGGCAILPAGPLSCPVVEACAWCEEGLLLSAGGQCVAECPEAGYFADWAAAPPGCTACHAQCKACIGPEPGDCLGRGSPGRRLALILGISLGLLLLLLMLLVLLWVLLFVRRRRQHALDKDPAAGADDEHSTVMNTIVELSLPGRILVNVAQDFAPVGGDPLGAGTQASVFVARAVRAGIGRRLGCPDVVAIKQMKAAQLRPAQYALFQGEVALMWLLREAPNVVRLYGYSEQPPAIVMECFETDLRALLHSDVPLAQGTILDICQQWASGLEAMHLAGVAHCDLKPGNVFVSHAPGAGWRAALGDLGTSRSLNADRSSALVNRAPELNALTARYAGPEVLAAFRQKRSLDPELHLMADVYSAAIMLWECLARRLPWADMGFEDIASAVLGGQRPEIAFSGPLADLLPLAWDTEPFARPPVMAFRQKLTMAWMAAAAAE
ncbi:TKL protein kinase [Fonticula alba]|uniref:TKL protein kinase n=1 Tax=Fonticula alba TaxID=691883 RepID=A0A058Z2B9_FONAL|nr:TKL protein kinase [Fonticula alba]KCV68063.1 TKL protein kinase [Fonticula alba]|eukprot:XP_009497630.1 TKL protein kinase [Fonticula alba]